MSVSFTCLPDGVLKLEGGDLDDVRGRVNALECAVAFEWGVTHEERCGCNLSLHPAGCSWPLPVALTDYRTPEEIVSLLRHVAYHPDFEY